MNLVASKAEFYGEFDYNRICDEVLFSEERQIIFETFRTLKNVWISGVLGEL